MGGAMGTSAIGPGGESAMTPGMTTYDLPNSGPPLFKASCADLRTFDHSPN